MKTTKLSTSKWLPSLAILTALLNGALLIAASRSTGGYVAHEWGTFTSVQGGDGALLSWRPLESSRLPGFVYDWKKPGLGRQSMAAITFTKQSMITLQRMETPVIYFYSDREETV